MIILSVHSGYHDACVALHDDYRLVAAVALERLTRRKIDGGRIPVEAIDECLAIAGCDRRDVGAVMLGRGAFPARFYAHLPWNRELEATVRRTMGAEKHKSMERELCRYGRTDDVAMFRVPEFLSALDLPDGNPVRFFNHHEAHALPCLFHTDWDEALLYTADGGGDNVQYSHRVFRGGKLEELFGGDNELRKPMRVDSVGLAYGFATQALGYKINRHEGKLTGLAAWGEPVLFDAIAKHFRIDDAGQILSDFDSNGAMRKTLHGLFEGQKREHVAASIQVFLEEFVIGSVRRLLNLTGNRKLGLAGGVFANVRLNQRLAEELPVDEVFIYPAMSDQGLAAGGALRFLLDRDGMDTWLANRYPLETLYYGRDYGDAIDRAMDAEPAAVRVTDAPVEASAALLESGKIVALYCRGMEYGPRALGARTILGSPADAAINDTLNKRLSRTEFMPFAPVVAEEDAEIVFDLGPATNYAARFMTITCRVKDGWAQRIPAVVHVDGTARPQVIRRDWNPLYYDILAAFKARTGLPILINTSFNVHEEPIVNAPAECIQALVDGRVDYVATERGLYTKGP